MIPSDTIQAYEFQPKSTLSPETKRLFQEQKEMFSQSTNIYGKLLQKSETPFDVIKKVEEYVRAGELDKYSAATFISRFRDNIRMELQPSELQSIRAEAYHLWMTQSPIRQNPEELLKHSLRIQEHIDTSRKSLYTTDPPQILRGSTQCRDIQSSIAHNQGYLKAIRECLGALVYNEWAEYKSACPHQPLFIELSDGTAVTFGQDSRTAKNYLRDSPIDTASQQNVPYAMGVQTFAILKREMQQRNEDFSVVSYSFDFESQEVQQGMNQQCKR